MGQKRTLSPVSDEQGQRRRDLEARERILSTTLRMLGTLGYSRLSIGGIAQEAAVGKATIYRSWANKAALVLDAVRVQLPEVPVADIGDSKEEIVAVAETLAEIYGSPKVRLVLPALVSDAAADPELGRRLVEELIEQRKKQSVEVLDRAVERGALPQDADVSTVLDMWAGLMLFRSLFYGVSLDKESVRSLVSATLASPPRTAPGDERARPTGP
ncbi:TetR/AcrR family transcriptional regulator [Streptomyces mexicanus]|uniref:TetR/AcrR family transcriptional regulator n=1 Tax=Streptomyces mexicanus TaxID=178566 RepID=A0A7X1HYD6_9ACTN|nr:TetR/AcrR family transcriptional regulator [Streptomyces mexicanus]MBC2865206.1 TetR/AcrR family transcriptional regulator [Streptomyces mexicanus]